MTHRTYGTHGPWATILHGGPGAPGHMAGLAAELAFEFRILEPFERRADGGDLTVDVHVGDLATLLAHYAGDAPGFIIGFSSGAITALTFAARCPHSVKGVILVGSATCTRSARAEFKRRFDLLLDANARDRLAAANAISNLDDRLAERARIVLPYYFVDPVEYPRDVWVDGRGHAQTWRDMLRLQESGVHPEEFAEVEAPVLMLHGRADPHPGRHVYESLQGVIPQLQYVELDRCGHYPWLERGARKEFLETLFTWLRERS